MSSEDRAREDDVFGQELSVEDLDAAAGGVDSDSDIRHCVQKHARSIYEGGFPNCAATVEDGSQCGTNDACYNDAIVYWDVKGRPGDGPYAGESNCEKAWR
jgi:hypothetical protein